MRDTSSNFRVAREDLARFMQAVLKAAGADQASANAVTRALITASRMGTDSHGLRLLPHYLQALKGGRINGAPDMQFHQRLAATGFLDADDGLGHLAGYTAMEHAMAMAETVGMGAVAVGNSSHFGAAGCYALAAAERGYLAWRSAIRILSCCCMRRQALSRYQPHRLCGAGGGRVALPAGYGDQLGALESRAAVRGDRA